MKNKIFIVILVVLVLLIMLILFNNKKVNNEHNNSNTEKVLNRSVILEKDTDVVQSSLQESNIIDYEEAEEIID